MRRKSRSRSTLSRRGEGGRGGRPRSRSIRYAFLRCSSSFVRRSIGECKNCGPLARRSRTYGWRETNLGPRDSSRFFFELSRASSRSVVFLFFVFFYFFLVESSSIRTTAGDEGRTFATKLVLVIPSREARRAFALARTSVLPETRWIRRYAAKCQCPRQCPPNNWLLVV